MEQEGLFFLQPVYNMLFDNYYLNLPRSSVRVCYKAYHNTCKGIRVGPNDLSLEDVINQELTSGKTENMKRFKIILVCAININGGLHALVLDTVENITQFNQSEGYEIGDVKLIFKNTHDDEKNGKPKKYTINAKSARAPDIFYFVHIDVDLNQITNCTCQKRWCKCRDGEESDSETDGFSESSENLQESQTSDNDDLKSTKSHLNEASDDEPEEKKHRV